MKRQRGRNRGGGGNKPQQHNANRAFDSNGPEGVKVRGAAQGVFEKYQQLARDAAQGGDRVLAENHLQHAEHYFRVLRAMQPARPVTDFIGREATSGFDIDFEAEPEEVEATEPEAAAESEGEDRQRDDRQQGDRPRFDRQRDDRPRDGQQQQGDRPQRDRFEGQGQGQGQGRRDRWRERDDRQRDERPASEARDDRPREDRPRDERPRDDRPREDRPQREGRRFDRGDRPERGDPLAVVEPQATPLTAEAPAEGSPRLRGQDGAVSELPAFLGRSSAPASVSAEAEVPAAEAAPKPRRRRAPRTEGPAETEDA
ncbi:hypothetical protein QO010_002251 [Caulobacter ginsengisoli]|uniref:DUF4167 domain-containing protein n=2 Tax=Caulobacter ginsengisoli TaxID=400775 RepID=A0ABU0IR32_9CAUL|nr:hypothetical protein [Caulobacter ginsengisoli]